MHRGISRRAILAAGTALLSATQAEPQTQRTLKVTIFSKHLQFLQGGELAKFAADIGFDGVDITVRKGGHIEPARVGQELPLLVDLIRRHGLEVPMVTTEIVDAETPFAEDILKTMSQLGIRNYRWIGFRYAANRPYAMQLDAMKVRIAKLAALNARYQACSMYHTESGVGQVGASIWTIYMLLKDFDPNQVGVNYDVGHATIEGGLGGWINSFEIIRPYLRGIVVKDFVWRKNSQGDWRPQWLPLGEGMVRLPEFFAMVADTDFPGPVQLHFEYLPGNGKKIIPISREEVFSDMKRDLGRLRAYLVKAGL